MTRLLIKKPVILNKYHLHVLYYNAISKEYNLDQSVSLRWFWELTKVGVGAKTGKTLCISSYNCDAV